MSPDQLPKLPEWADLKQRSDVPTTFKPTSVSLEGGTLKVTIRNGEKPAASCWAAVVFQDGLSDVTKFSDIAGLSTKTEDFPTPTNWQKKIALAPQWVIVLITYKEATKAVLETLLKKGWRDKDHEPPRYSVHVMAVVPPSQNGEE